MEAAILAPAAVLVGGIALSEASRVKDRRLERERLRIASSGIAAASLLIWPAVFGSLVGFDAGGLVLAAFAWPALMMAIDLWLARSRSRGSLDQEGSRQSSIVNNAHGLVGAAWAMGSLLLIINKEGHSQQSAVVVMASLLMAIAFLLPSFDLGRTDDIIVHQAKRSVLHMAIGLFCGGIILASTSAHG